ncbi:MAG TPA: DUF2815 family protein [Aurantimonas coralicida]|uniref:DUF2815 family protein n=2 Tax=root TaxID=1 RepID=A0A9C9NIZ0_9HYPH|nr:DUF2815 family protein [Aurantimonas coralicida]HEU02592.1 DUF2815 family protein [Aurantimonas coralicida]
MAEKDPTKVKLNDVRLSFPNLFAPRGFGKSNRGKPAYSASFFVPKDGKRGEMMYDDILDAIDAAKEKEWGSDSKKWPKVKKVNIAVKDGDKPADEDDDPKPEEEGMYVVAARNYKQPRVLDRDKTELHESDGLPYGGCYVDGIVRFWAQTYEGIPRINCSLEGVRYRRKGEPFGAAPLDPDEFDNLPEEEEEDEGGSRRSSRRRDAEEGDDDRGSRRSRRDAEEGDDDRGSRRSRRDRDDEDEDRGSRRSRRDKDDEDEDRGSRRSRRDEDDEDEDRGSRRSRRDEDDDSDDRPARRSRRDADEDEDRGSRRSRRNNDDI